MDIIEISHWSNYISEISVSGTAEETFNGYLSKSQFGIEKLSEDNEPNFDNTLVRVDRINSNLHIYEMALNFSYNSMNFHPTAADGALYRYQGNFYCMIDNNFYIRDTNHSTNQFHFSTANEWTPHL